MLTNSVNSNTKGGKPMLPQKEDIGFSMIPARESNRQIMGDYKEILQDLLSMFIDNSLSIS
jgi:hypothetical protein